MTAVDPGRSVIESVGQSVHVVLLLMEYVFRGHCVQGGIPLLDVYPGGHCAIKHVYTH